MGGPSQADRQTQRSTKPSIYKRFDTGLVGDCQPLGYRLAVQFQIRRHIRERRKHEGAFGDAWMGQHEIGLVHCAIEMHQHVQIDDTWAPLLGAHAAQLSLDVQAAAG